MEKPRKNRSRPRFGDGDRGSRPRFGDGERSDRPRFGGGNRFGRERGFGERSEGRSRFRSEGGFGGRGHDFRKMPKYTVTCDECKKECQVPFKPTEGKPVYCDECFKTKPTGNQKNEFEKINEKLDKIMQALKIE